MWPRQVFIPRAMYGMECKSRRLVFEDQSASFSNCDQQFLTKLDDHCLWRDPRSRVLNSIQFICISISLLMPNKHLYTWRGDYCKCVRPAQLPVLTEVRAPSLWEQNPWCVPHRDRPGYNNHAPTLQSTWPAHQHKPTHAQTTIMTLKGFVDICYFCHKICG
jgi:hypothetical protein